MERTAVDRRARFFDDGAWPFFGWYHATAQGAARDLVAVVCAPIGSEYTRSHRSLRHLADRLAAAGVPALRFDYHGTGNSPGTDLDPDRVAAWRSNIVAACRHARALSGASRVCLVGVRLGATLAALASAEAEADLLVLWNAPAKGKPYVRELQAVAMMAARTADADGRLEAAGYVTTAETLAALRAIDLAKAPIRARRALLVARDDLAPDPSLGTIVASQGIAMETLIARGWNGMMADHQHTVVPDAALDDIVAWVAADDPHPRPVCADPDPTLVSRAPSPAPRAPLQPGVRTMAVRLHDEARDAEATVEETLCRFGADGHLFGVLTRASPDPARPAIVMFNGGAVHHVGPNRLYVTLARSLAALGFACLRFDLEGIGDSVLRGPGRENHPYPETATADARAALDFLRHEHGYRDLIALGLCSGAHTAFHSALQLEAHEIRELVLINPYAFYWKEGMSLDVVAKLADAQQYKKSMRDPSRWLKLLRGDVNLKRLLDVAIAYPRTVGKSYYGALLETLAPEKAPPLARDLRRLFASDRRVTVLVAEGDPGTDIIMSEAKATVRRGMREGRMRLETIADGDHTFTLSRSRRELIKRVAETLHGRRPERRARVR